MAFVIITIDGVDVNSGGSQPPIGQSQLIVSPGDGSGLAQPVNRDNPMPAALGYGVSGMPVIAHDFAGNETSPVAFMPIAGRPFNVDLTYLGNCDGHMQLVRSFDQGATFSGLTQDGNPVGNWDAPASEHFTETEVGVFYYLVMTNRTVGNVQTRISQ